MIESFRKDKPYDQFLKEQIAGDLMKFSTKHEQAEKIIATGFLLLQNKTPESTGVSWGMRLWLLALLI